MSAAGHENRRGSSWPAWVRNLVLIACALAVSATHARQQKEPDPEPAEKAPKPGLRLGSTEARHGMALSAHFPADGKTLVTGGYGEFRVWDLATKKLLHRYPLDKANIWSTASTPDNRHLLAMTAEGVL